MARSGALASGASLPFCLPLRQECPTDPGERLLRRDRASSITAMSDDERDAAWAELSAVLPTGWAVFPPVFEPDIGMWHVYARDLRGAPREYQPWEDGVGADEATAVRTLAQRFRHTDGDETA